MFRIQCQTSLKWSCFFLLQGHEPVSTIYANSGMAKAVDFIWHGGDSLSVSGVLDAVAETAVSQPGIPSAVFPSDHLSIKADLYFK